MLDLNRFAVHRYGAQGEVLVRKLMRVNPDFGVLAIDPGIALRADAFLEFVKSHHLKDREPWEARELFARHLGTVTLFRG